MRLETDTAGIQVPVPLGYVASKATGENTVKTGYVIYEGEEEVNNANVVEAQKTRNQYVWIPVSNIKEIYGIDINGKLWGKEWYDSNGNVNWTEENGIFSIKYPTSNREPDIIKMHDTDSRMKTLGLEAKTGHEFLQKLELEFIKMVESVEKYGGFYVGRYETGALSKNTPVIRKGNTDISYQSWYTMYKRCKNLKGDNENVETEMIWGCQFDRVLTWLIETGGKSRKDIIENSISWGNFRWTELKYTNTNGEETIKPADSAVKIPTGSSEQTKANNIYDLAGNMFELSKKSSSKSYRKALGGEYAVNVTNVTKVEFPITYEFSNEPTSARAYDGVRAVLHIK